MTPSRTAKRIAIFAALAGAFVLLDQLFGADAPASSVVSASSAKRPVFGSSAEAATPRASPTVASAMQDIGLDRLDRRQAGLSRAGDETDDAEIDLFGAVSWKPPEPPALRAPPPPPPPAPVVPPFPYAYLGALTEDGVRTTFFAKAERVLPVKAGDVVDAVYRIDEMTDKQMTLTYLPLNESMVVALGVAR